MSARTLQITDTALTGIGYVAYPALLIYLIAVHSWLIGPCIVVPALCFGFITLLRAVVNETRPYEMGAPNLLDKQTQGRSFPSRHVASMTAIACSWMLVNDLAGAALCILAAALAYVRVRGNAHTVKDVIAGFVFAFSFCAIGYAIAFAIHG